MAEKLEGLCLDVAFTSSTVRELFVSCVSSKKCMTICSMEESGHFHGEFKMNGDGHMQRPSSLATDPNVEHQSHGSCQKQIVRSPIAIPPSITEEQGESDLAEELQNQHQPVEHDNAPSGDVKEAMVTGSSRHSSYVSTGDKKAGHVNAKSNVQDLPQPASLMSSNTNNNVNIPEELANLNDDIMEESTPYTYQPQQDEQTHLEPTNAPDGDVQVSTVDSSSHSHLPPSKDSKQSHYNTTSEYKASDEGTNNTLIAGLPPDKRRADQEQIEKRRVTVHCLLHGLEKDHYNYDEMFASEFEKFLSREPNTVPPLSTDNKEDNDYMWYIEDHLKKKQCPSFCARLWKFCTANNLCNLYKFADEGLLLHSKNREDKVGSICTDFTDLENMEEIGRGGFGVVYLWTSPSGKQLAIKKETKHPLIDANPKLFNQILKLKNPHVIATLEYLVAFSGGKKSYLLVMPFMNKKGLDEQFKRKLGCGSVLAYMTKYPGQKKFIFRNFLEIFCQVFEALDYLKTQRLVHRDVKSSNILMQQNCSCDSPLMCTCPEGDTIHCVLGDMNLLCNEGETSVITSEMWHRMALHPAGTPRMKAPESYYRTGEGDSVIGHKSDVWSGCVTMINALIGREVNDIPDPQIGIFLRTATQTVGNASKDIDSCSDMLDNIINKYLSILEGGSVDASINGNMNSLLTELQVLHKELDKSGKALKKVQAFQGGVPEARDKESPLAGILFTVYVANNLHWKCLTTLSRVYDTPLWDCICDTLDVITEGVRFIPENRKNAGEIVELLKPIKTKVIS